MTITIPEWLLWAIGIPLSFILILMALIGIWFVFLLYKEF